MRNMKSIEIKRIDELGYCISEYILRNRLYNASITCSSSIVLEIIMIYMTEIGIPWELEHDNQRIHINKKHDDKLHRILIALNTPGSCKENDAYDALFFLRDSLQGRMDELVIDPDSFDIESVPLHLQNEEIRKMFLKTFMIAESEIDIISPWMNFSVVNDALINLMRQALQRGVAIKIINGLLPESDEYNQVRSERSDQVAARLKEVFSGFGRSFQISRDNIHYKLVLCDEKYKLEGGYNYLSFTGDYTDPETRREGSPFGRDVDEIRFLRKEYFGND